MLDEKGDFTRAAAQYAEEWGRADDIIRITPGGKTIWNIVYNPNLPTWAVATSSGGSSRTSTRVPPVAIRSGNRAQGARDRIPRAP